jgi:acyl carrier protein
MSRAQEIRAIVTEEWRGALDTRDAAAGDDFFAMGGNSIMAMAMARRVERRLGIAFPMDVLFIDSTLAAVVEACAKRSEHESAGAAAGGAGD